MLQSTGKRLWIPFCLIITMGLLLSMQFAQEATAAIPKSSLGTNMANQNLYRLSACEYEGKIYYSSFTQIYVINRDDTDGSVTTACICDMDDLRPEYLTVLGKYIYAIVKTGSMVPYGRLARIDPNSGHYKIYKGKKSNNIEKLYAANGRLYYNKNGNIYSMKTDGSARKTIKKGYVSFLAMNEKRMYYTDSADDPGPLYSCDLNGKHIKKVYQSKYPIYNLIENNGYIYFSSGNHYGINRFYRKKVSHNSIAKKIYSSRISVNIGRIELLDADNKYVYFINKKNRLTRLDRKTGKSKKILGGSVRGVRGIFNDLMIVEIWSGTHDGGFSCKLINRTTGEVLKRLYGGSVTGASG